MDINSMAYCKTDLMENQVLFLGNQVTFSKNRVTFLGTRSPIRIPNTF